MNKTQAAAKEIRHMNKTQAAAKEIWAWIVKNELNSDAQLLSADRWKALGHSMGNSSLFTITTEGPLYMLVNGYSDVSYSNKLLRELDKIEKKHGIYHELGYAWSMHFYPR